MKVTPAGRKVYIFQYRMGGRGSKVRRFTIGKHGSITADAARSEAGRLSLLVSQGVDPQSDKAERQRETVELAFADYVTRFTNDCLKVEWKNSWQEAESMLRRFAVPILKNKPLPEIVRSDVSAVLRPLKQMPATEKKAFAVLRRLFRWAVNQGDLAISPVQGMEGPQGVKARDRVLKDWELLLVWEASKKLGYPFGPIVRLLILTGARREEVAALPWAELSQDEALWSLPSERAKNGRATDVPLSALSLNEIQTVQDNRDKRDKRDNSWPRKGFLFTTTGTTPVSGHSRSKKRLDKILTDLNQGEPLEHWTLHDLRRTLATGMQRMGVRFEVTEAILNHVGHSRSGVAGVYQHHDWADEKRTALQSWADYIDRLLRSADATNVVSIGDAKSA